MPVCQAARYRDVAEAGDAGHERQGVSRRQLEEAIEWARLDLDYLVALHRGFHHASELLDYGSVDITAEHVKRADGLWQSMLTMSTFTSRVFAHSVLAGPGKITVLGRVAGLLRSMANITFALLPFAGATLATKDLQVTIRAFYERIIRT